MMSGGGGHMPMHTNQDFADVLVRFGELAIVAAEKVSSIKDKSKQLSVLKNIIKAISRVFWFTVEFGLMRKGRKLKA
ncbi:MAG: phenylalanine-4-hydroxylase [Chlamydiales bacterium]|jgi:phenylalanine-4-hydroxylase